MCTFCPAKVETTTTFQIETIDYPDNRFAGLPEKDQPKGGT